MTRDQVRELLTLYRQELLRYGATKPIRNTEDPNVNHLLWMCNEIERFLDLSAQSGVLYFDKHWDKANRWLGFIQGAMCCWYIRPISVLRDDNRTSSEEENHGTS